MMILGFWNGVESVFKWCVSFCKEYGLLIIVVGLFVYGTGFLITLVKGVYDNHKELVSLITERENSAQMFQSACVNDYDSKQKMESKRSNSSSNDEDVNLSDDKEKIDSRGDSVKIEGDSIINIDSSSQKDRLIE